MGPSLVLEGEKSSPPQRRESSLQLSRLRSSLLCPTGQLWLFPGWKTVGLARLLCTVGFHKRAVPKGSRKSWGDLSSAHLPSPYWNPRVSFPAFVAPGHVGSTVEAGTRAVTSGASHARSFAPGGRMKKASHWFMGSSSIGSSCRLLSAITESEARAATASPSSVSCRSASTKE